MPSRHRCSSCATTFKHLRSARAHRRTCILRHAAGIVATNDLSCSFSASWAILWEFAHISSALITSRMSSPMAPPNFWRDFVSSIAQINSNATQDSIDHEHSLLFRRAQHILGGPLGDGLNHEWLPLLFEHLPLQFCSGTFGDLVVLSALCNGCKSRHLDARFKPRPRSQYLNFKEKACPIDGCRVSSLIPSTNSRIVDDAANYEEDDVASARLIIVCSKRVSPQQAVAAMLKTSCYCCSRILSGNAQTSARCEPPRLVIFSSPMSVGYRATFPVHLTILDSQFELFARIFEREGYIDDHCYSQIKRLSGSVICDDSNQQLRYEFRSESIGSCEINSPIVFYRKVA
jgi:hypothetical protein